MIAGLNDVIAIRSDDVRNVLTVRVTCAWDVGKEVFEPVRQFPDAAGKPLPEGPRSINLMGLFG